MSNSPQYNQQTEPKHCKPEAEVMFSRKTGPIEATTNQDILMRSENKQAGSMLESNNI